MNPNLLSVAYFALAILCGVIVAARLVPFPADLIVLLLLGAFAVMLRRRLPGSGRSIALELMWLGLFVVTWLGLGVIINRPI